jgi:hypothetical protein
MGSSPVRAARQPTPAVSILTTRPLGPDFAAVLPAYRLSLWRAGAGLPNYLQRDFVAPMETQFRARFWGILSIGFRAVLRDSARITSERKTPMGARLNNNLRTKNRGTVGIALPLSIAFLQSHGLQFLPDKVNGRTIAQWLRNDQLVMRRFIVAEFVGVWGPCIRIESNHSDTGDQLIALKSRPMRFGGHRWWFICPLNGDACDTLYYFNGEFASRRAHRLTYRSQSRGDADWLFNQRDKLRAQVLGTENRGPRRGNRLRIAQSRLERMEDAIDGVGGQILGVVLHRKTRAKVRRQVLADTRRCAAATWQWRYASYAPPPGRWPFP